MNVAFSFDCTVGGAQFARMPAATFAGLEATRRMNGKKPEQEASLAGTESALLIAKIAETADREAFAKLFRYYAPRIKAYMIRSGASAGQADELAQEAMLTVWRKATYFNPERAGAGTWIFTIARNLRIDAFRRQRDQGGMNQDPSDLPDSPEQSDTIVIAAEREERVRSALMQLSDDQRRIVMLSFFDEKAHGEISRELKIPLGTVKSRIRLAMIRLRDLLDGQS